MDVLPRAEISPKHSTGSKNCVKSHFSQLRQIIHLELAQARELPHGVQNR
jgi:hypothetical protein